MKKRIKINPNKGTNKGNNRKKFKKLKKRRNVFFLRKKKKIEKNSLEKLPSFVALLHFCCPKPPSMLHCDPYVGITFEDEKFSV
jgi:hypothetical protein